MCAAPVPSSPLLASATVQLSRRSPPKSVQLKASASTGAIRYLDVANYMGREIGRSLRQQHQQAAAASTRSGASAPGPRGSKDERAKSQFTQASNEKRVEKRQLEASASDSLLQTQIQVQREHEAVTEARKSLMGTEWKSVKTWEDLTQTPSSSSAGKHQGVKDDPNFPGTLEEYFSTSPSDRAYQDAKRTNFEASQERFRGGPEVYGPTPTESEVCEKMRESIRKGMLAGANGNAWQAFKALDTSGSGRVSQQDFAPGISRLGVNWQDVSGLKIERDLFKLFDTQKKGLVRFADVFPLEAARGADTERCGTTEFWGRWCRKNRDAENMQRGPKWVSSTPDEELKVLYDAVQHREDVADKRKWMRGTMRRLKSQGKSDARCREAVALHLPRGTGPKDRDGVQTVSVHDVRASKKRYTEEVKEHISNTQSVVNEMREQRKLLQQTKHMLYAVTEAPRERKRVEEDRKDKLTKLELGNGPGMLRKIQEDSNNEKEFLDEHLAPTEALVSAAAHVPRKSKSNQLIAQECNLELDDVEDLFKEYQRYSDSSENMGRKAFAKLLPHLNPTRTLVESDLDAWFEQAVTAKDRRGLINFAQFVEWFVHSELRENKS